MYLHSASRLTGKFMLDLCISKCVYACAPARASVCVRACTHSCVWQLWVYVCACVCVSSTYAAWMWASWHVWVYACFCFLDIFMRLNWSYFLFGLSVMFSVISIPVKTSKLNKREREREREREGGREGERERERERERWRGGGEREREREREQDEEGGRKRGREEGGMWCKRIQELTYWLQWCSHQIHDFQVWRLARESWNFAVIHWPWHASLRYLAELNSQLRQTYDQTQVAFECCSSWAAAPLATVLKQVHHRLCNKDVLDSWLSTASQSRQFSSTAHLERRLRETDEWRRPPRSQACSPKFSSPFLLFMWRPWRNNRVKYLH